MPSWLRLFERGFVDNYFIYSQSDQETLRDPLTDSTYHGVSVPGTIAAYFRDATAGFILTSGKPYFIDLRTPLFQNELSDPKASHLALADRISPSLGARVRASGHFPPEFYTDGVLDELVEGVLGLQRGYAEEAMRPSQKLGRYARLRAIARGEAAPSDAGATANRPELILAPYFCCTSAQSDPWLAVIRRIWNLVKLDSDAGEVSPVVGLNSEDPGDLANVLALIPPELNRRVLFWLTGFDERAEPARRLRDLWRVVEAYSDRFELQTLYGSYFSVLLSHAGLRAMGSGLAYSEARRWPELSASGAAPARYYVPRLHSFLSPGIAQLLIEREPYFACTCRICEGSSLPTGPFVVGLNYHELKKHFALARSAEIDFVSGSDLAQARDALLEASDRLRPFTMPSPTRIQGFGAPHLEVWSSVLTAILGSA